MPLLGKGHFKENVRTLMGEVGQSPHVQSRAQALAIAYSKERGYQEGGPVDAVALPELATENPAVTATHELVGTPPGYGLARGLVTLPERATRAAGELFRQGDVYDPGPAVEAAGLTNLPAPYPGTGGSALGTLFLRKGGDYGMQMVDETGRVRGPIQGYVTRGGGTPDFHVGWIGGYGGATGGPGGIGLSDIRSLARAIAAEYPEAETISGYRVSGVRGRTGAADAKMRLPKLTEEQRKDYFAQKEKVPGIQGPTAIGDQLIDLARRSRGVSDADEAIRQIEQWINSPPQRQTGGLVQPTPDHETDASAPHPDDHFTLIDVAPIIERPAYIDTLERLHGSRMDAQGIPRQMGGPTPAVGGPAMPMSAPGGTAPIVGSAPRPGGTLGQPQPAMPPLATPWATSNPMRAQDNQWPATGLYSSGGGLVMQPGHYQHGGLTGSSLSSLGRQAHYSGINAVHGLKLVQSTTPGRTDRIPVKARAGSFVLPADVVSGLGQGNTLAGAKMWGQAISHAAGPYGVGAGSIPHARMPSLPRPTIPKSPRGQKAYQEGGDVDDGLTSILVAGGEVIVDPDYVTGVGDGDLEEGSKRLHESVLGVRKQVGDNTKLPPPVQ